MIIKAEMRDNEHCRKIIKHQDSPRPGETEAVVVIVDEEHRERRQKRVQEPFLIEDGNIIVEKLMGRNNPQSVGGKSYRTVVTH